MVATCPLVPEVGLTDSPVPVAAAVHVLTPAVVTVIARFCAVLATFAQFPAGFSTITAAACVPAHVCVAEAPLGTALVVNLTDSARVAPAVVAATVTVTAVVPAAPDDLLNVH